MAEPKLFMVLLGSKAKQRNIEQHDFFFGIAYNLQELIPRMRDFWPEAGSSLHIDGWREVRHVEGYSVNIIPTSANRPDNNKRLFFVNLGGYISGRLEEQHYTLLTVQDDRKWAVKAATDTEFFKTNTIKAVKSAAAHIDEKYGIDVDEIYRIEDLLSDDDKTNWHIHLKPDIEGQADSIQLGYLKLDKVQL
ncbi:DUF1543 domain-containing protein [Mucilaginibacter auburnensis]|uniref:Uncharacterized protein DUF1543 n=1 Tax=Mucilaginibacter auburnensis TaxID=1457233 RepID=A0A2H9VMC0_9SPHI|nr:DUF1543 domain-containing protein [Mucilaginibacter auburnensis]PJJ79497.1 uncharacterized protein DUF1543 [Mucilaginibacter auburnensis]